MSSENLITKENMDTYLKAIAKQYRNHTHYINELEAKLAVYTHLTSAIDDIKLGRVQSADSVFAEILNHLENLNA